jgi:hypothetical protein
MIRPVKSFVVPWHAQFLSMLPRLRAHAAIAFRHLKPEAREEAIQEAVANALVAFVRLVQLKKADLAYPTVLARYAVAQIHDGRKVGGKLNVRDVSSKYAQRRRGFHVGRLDQFDEEENQWQEILVEDRHVGPAEVVATKLDFTEWLKSLPARIRRITKLLATGEKTSIVAEKFGVSAGRISQLRKELAQAWKKFQGEEVDSRAVKADHHESYCPAA